MKKMVLIGGGDIGKGNTNYETKEIDQEIVKLTKKENPNFLFIGLASSYSDSYYDTIKKIYRNLGCNCTYLKKKNIINNPSIVKNKLSDADIIYIGGGDTLKLKETILEYKIDLLLKEAYNRGCVISGISAGAILLTNEGFSDSFILRKESENHQFIKGLNFINISFCPHYHENIKKTKELQKEIKSTKKEVYSLENGTALKIIDDKIELIKSIPTAKGYKVSYKNKYLEKEL